MSSKLELVTGMIAADNYVLARTVKTQTAIAVGRQQIIGHPLTSTPCHLFCWMTKEAEFGKVLSCDSSCGPGGPKTSRLIWPTGIVLHSNAAGNAIGNRNQ